MTNTGDTPDSFNLSLSGASWPVQLSSSSFNPLAPGSYADLTLRVSIPSQAAAGAQDSVTLTASSLGYSLEPVSATLTTTARTLYGVSASAPLTAQPGDPGQVVEYTVYITNTGNTNENFNVTVSNNTWVTQAPTTSGSLAPGGQTSVVVKVAIPPLAQAGASDTARVRVTAQHDASKTVLILLTTSVQLRYGWSFCPHQRHPGRLSWNGAVLDTGDHQYGQHQRNAPGKLQQRLAGGDQRDEFRLFGGPGRR